ncbi:hypothetical protein Tco_1298122, partial [Tanacetum coccineum]
MAADISSSWRLAAVHRHDISHIGHGQNRCLAVKIGRLGVQIEDSCRKFEVDLKMIKVFFEKKIKDHNLWDVIVNEDQEKELAPTTGETSAPPAPKTAKQLAARRNQGRVKSILLLAIPDEYLFKFHNVADAKSLWEAIESRFGGNVESKKMQKITNEVSNVSGDFGVSAAGGINQVPTTPCAHDIAYSFLAQPT